MLEYTSEVGKLRVPLVNARHKLETNAVPYYNDFEQFCIVIVFTTMLRTIETVNEEHYLWLTLSILRLNVIYR